MTFRQQGRTVRRLALSFQVLDAIPALAAIAVAGGLALWLAAANRRA